VAVEVDHIVPPQNGGMDGLLNLRSLCRTHGNGIKADRCRGEGALPAKESAAAVNPWSSEYWWIV
jgi:hypothetical protein